MAFKAYDNHLSPWPQDQANYNTVGKKPTGHDKKSRTKIKIQLTQLLKGMNMLSFFRGIVGQKFKQKRLEKGKLLLSEVVRESNFGLVFVGDTFSSGNAFYFWNVLTIFCLMQILQEHALDYPISVEN